MSDKKEVLLLSQTWQSSMLSNAGTVLTFVLMIGLGVLLDSSAMQWMGAIVFFITLLARIMTLSARNTMTIEQARAKLDELEKQIHV